jgi:hypothetical protein
MIKPIHINHNVAEKYKQATKIGIVGALLMVAYIVVIEIATSGTSYGLKFLKYFFLAIPMTMGLCKMSKDAGFNNPYLPQSTFYTAVIAVTAATVFLVAYWIVLPIEGIDMATIVLPTLAEQEQLAANTLPLPVPCMLFLEVFAIGMIIGFAILVYGSDIEQLVEQQEVEAYPSAIKKVA